MSEKEKSPKTKLTEIQYRGIISNSLITVDQELGLSIWFAQETGSVRGMIECYPGSATSSISIIDYPTNFGQTRSMTERTSIPHMISNKYKAASVLMVDPHKRSGIVFDTKTREYSAVFSFQPSGSIRFVNFDRSSSCIAIGDYIHIFHGSNPRGSYTICSLKDNTFRNLVSQPHQNDLHYVAIVKSHGSYQASSEKLISAFSRQQTASDIPSVVIDLVSQFLLFELYKFGGRRRNPLNYFPVDTFYIGVLENGDAALPIKWTVKPNYRMKYPLKAFGYVHYGPFIVTFGGLIEHDFTDAIYVLDLRSKSGWIQSQIKCPMKTTYHAVIDDTQTIHLFAAIQHKLHNLHISSLQLKDIIIGTDGTEDYRMLK